MQPAPIQLADLNAIAMTVILAMALMEHVQTLMNALTEPTTVMTMQHATIP